jgi:hypothetical protein
MGHRYEKALCETISFADSADVTFYVHPFMTEEGMLVVLPAGWNPDKILVNTGGVLDSESIESDDATSSDDFETPSLANDVWRHFKVDFEKDNYLHIENELGLGRKIKLRFVQSKIKSIFVNTKSGSMEKIDNSEDKSYDERGILLALDCHGKIIYDGKLAKIKGHGNSSWQSDLKKSYNIKLEDKAPLISSLPEKSYSLISNYSDQTGLYNWLSYRLCELVGMPYNIQYDYCNLYLNGNYNGLYLLCNKIKPGPNHLDITELEEETQLCNQKKLKRFRVKKISSDGTLLPNIINDFSIFRSGIEDANNPSDITGGYIIESHSRLGDNAGSFITKNGVRKSLKYPEYPTFEQVEYIQNLYNEMEEAVTSTDGYNIHTGKYYADYIDVSSFAIYYLIQEYLLNRDMELASFYIYKDNDSIDTRFYAGPIWDMDGLRRGDIYNIPNCYAMRAGIISPQNSQSASFRSSDHKGLFYYLFTHKDFAKQVKREYFKRFSVAAKKLWAVELDSLIHFVGTDWSYDALRWNRNHDLNYYVTDIKKFYNKRAGFMQEDMISDEKDYYRVIIDSPEGIGYSYHLLEFHVRKGQELNLPSLGIKRTFNQDEIIKLKN